MRPSGAARETCANPDNQAMTALLEELRQAGRRDSDGCFTWDLSRMLDKLARYQLRRPSDFLLRVVAAAVARGASCLEVTSFLEGVRLTWDGPELTLRDLQEVMPSLLRSDPRPGLCDLASAVNTARTLGRVAVECPDGRLSLQGQQLTVEPWDGPPGQRFEVRLKGWSRLTGWLKSPHELLSARCDLAPMEIRVGGKVIPAGEHRIVPLAILRVGVPPRPLSGSATAVDCSLPSSPWGEGYLMLGADSSRPDSGRLMHTGVAYDFEELTLCPGAFVLWWTRNLPMDLSRSGPAHGEEFFQWAQWVGRQLQDLSLLLLRNSPAVVGAELMDWLIVKGEGNPQVDQAPLFLRADTTRVCLAELTEQFERDGFLPVASNPGPCAWDPARVLVLAREDPAYHAVLKRFPNPVPVDHLADLPGIPRLPESGSYLVRMPLQEVPGEIGLRAAASLEELRELRQRGPSGWTAWTVHPMGLDLASGRVRPTLTDFPLPMAELYSSLLHLRSTTKEEGLIRFHLLQFFRWLGAALRPSLGARAEREGILKTLLDPEASVKLRFRHSKWSLGSPELNELATRLCLRTASGSPVSVQDLLREGGRRVYSPAPHPGCRLDLLILTHREAMVLACLLKPACRLVSLEVGPWSTCCWDILSSVEGNEYGFVQTCSLLGALVKHPESSACQLLRRLDPALKSPGRFHPDEYPDLSQPVGMSPAASAVLGRLTALAGPGRLPCSEHLLLALALEEGGAARALGDAGVTPERIRSEMFSFAERETLEDLGKVEALWEEAGLRAAFLTRRALAQLRRRHLQAALLDCQVAVELAPELAEAWSTRALATTLSGRPQDALELDERCLALAPSVPNYWSNRAENLMLCGRAQEAVKACNRALELEPGNSCALTLLARMLADPERGLQRCDQALLDPNCPLSVHEARSRHLLALGRADEARESLRAFLQASLDTLLENDLPERLRVAGETLRSLEGA